MLIAESGAYYPSLENAFLLRFLALKEDPLAQVAVVAASGRMLEHLQRTMATQRPGFLNVHFHTFSSLAEQVVENAGGLDKPVLSDPLFFDTLVKFIIKSDRPFHGFDDLAIPDGFPMAVRATLRDLMDSGAGADIVEAVKDGFLGKDVDIGSLKQLLHLYRLYLERLDKLPVYPRLALMKKAIQAAPTSPYLAQFREILFYGFYDATGVQTDFFQAVVKNHSSRIYLPFEPSKPAYAFAKRFRDTYLQPVIHEEIVVSTPENPCTAFDVLNVSGLRDEASVVAQKIRQAHDRDNVPFSEIMVVARSRDRLSKEFPRAFRELDIPFCSSIDHRASEMPYVRLVYDVLDEKVNSAEWVNNASWGEHSQRAEEVLKETDYWSAIQPAVAQMRVFDMIGKKVSKDDYLEVLKERLGRYPIQRTEETASGVMLLHAEAARGLSPRIMVIVGVEEKAFPRIIREDPFLRDDARMALANTLGYKISQKMTAHEEEELLFEILTTSAREKTIFTYQRSDDSGAVVGPSPFLRTWLEKRSSSLSQAAVTIPRSYREKLKGVKAEVSSRADLISMCLMSSETAAATFIADVVETNLPLGPRLSVQNALQEFSGPGPFDGEVGPQSPIRLSATDLETYGRCPFQYFVTRVLDIDVDDLTKSVDDVDNKLKGKLVHGFLELFFKDVTEGGKRPAPAKIPGGVFNKTFDAVFNEAAANEAAVWPVIWQAFIASTKAELEAILSADLASLAETDFQPTFFEERLSASLPVPLDGIEWVGKVDRIDVSGDSARVVDYKSGGKPTEGVVTSGLKGRRIQPSLYLLLCDAYFKSMKKPLSSVSFVYRYLKDPDMPEELSWDDWNAYQKALLETLRVQLESLRAGHYPIMPDDYCEWCGLATVCRKNDSLSVYRARQGSTQQLLQLRTKRK